MKKERLIDIEIIYQNQTSKLYKIILCAMQDPVDLTLIEQRLKSRDYYVTLHIFVADVNRMCANARIYNSAETIYFKMANKLEAFLDEYIHAHVVFNNPQ